MPLVDWLYRFWEVPDRLSTDQDYHVVVPMSLSPAKDGTVGATLRPVVAIAAAAVKSRKARLMVISNRYMVSGRNLCEEMVGTARHLGIPQEKIVTPVDPRDPHIRNTFTEAEFALKMLHAVAPERPRILIVANHLHLRRVLATFRTLNCHQSAELFWAGVSSPNAYTSDAYQKRFYKPLLFLVYEVLALCYSRCKGWA